MVKNFLIEKYDFLALISLCFYPGKKKVYLPDSIEFYPRNSKKLNLFMKIGNLLWGNDHIIRYPDYSIDFSKWSELLWSSNEVALDFLHKFESNFYRYSLGKFLSLSIKDCGVFEAIKKLSLEEVTKKVLFLKIYQVCKSEDINFHRVIFNSADNFQVEDFLKIKIPKEHVSKLAELFNFIFSKIYVLATLAISPYMLRECIKRGFVIRKPKIKKFDFGFHAVDSIHAQGFVKDALSFNLGEISYKNSVFVYSVWKFSPSEKFKLKEVITSIGASECDENNLPIPLSVLINHYLKEYLRGLRYAYLIIFSKELFAPWMIKNVQKIIAEYLAHEVFCHHFKIKVFFSRDDYSTKHITRTIVQNKFGLLNVGLQHSAFLYPKYIPQIAHVYFDTYFIAGPLYQQLWSPFWSRNKKLIPVGHKAEELVKSAKQNQELKEKFHLKYNKKITILLLISSHSDTISPFWLMKNRYTGIERVFDLHQDIHLILRPRYKDAISSFLSICPDINEYVKSGRCTIEFGDFSTQELIAHVDVLVAEDASSSLLESMCRDDLFSFFYMIRYGEFKFQKDLVVNSVEGFCQMISSYLAKDDKYYLAIKARQYIKANFTVEPAGQSMQRIGSTLNSLVKSI